MLCGGEVMEERTVDGLFVFVLKLDVGIDRGCCPPPPCCTWL